MSPYSEFGTAVPSRPILLNFATLGEFKEFVAQTIRCSSVSGVKLLCGHTH